MVVKEKYVSSPFWSVVSYCLSSNLMTLANKAVLSKYNFKMNFLLLAIQNFTTILVLLVFTRMGSVEHKPLTFSNSKRWFVVSLSLCAMIYTGSKALQMLSVPVFTIFKNLTIIITAYSERAWFNGSKITRVILLSFWLMIASSAISGWNDITSGNILKGNASIVTSYLWMAANCFTTAFFSLMMRFKIKDIGFKDFDTVYYNNILSIPVLLALSWLTERDLYGETIDIIANDTAGGLSFAIALTGVTAFFISYCSGWCVRVTSSTTLSMVGALNKLPIAVFGMLLFDDVFTFSGAMGIVLMFFGGVLYAKGKADQANSIKRETVEKSVKMTSDEKITVVVDDTKQRAEMENQDFKEPLPIEKPAARSFIENASNFLFPSYQSPQRASSPQSSTAPSSRQKVRLEPGHSHMDWASKKKSFAPNQLRRITISEMKLHNKKEDLWITVQGKVYTCTEYISYHPGGRSQLMRGAGIDATDLFMKVHSWVNIESLLKECCLGYLVPDE